MSRTTWKIGVVTVLLLAAMQGAQAQRGGRGGGGGARGAGGGMSAGGAAAASAYGAGAAAGTRTTTTAPAGGTRTAGSGSGSYTTQRGTTVDYAGAGTKGTTAGGVNYGKGVGGVQVTTASGKQVSKVGTAGAAAGPGGNAVASRSGAATASGPGGTYSTAYRGGVAVGPNGATAGGARVATGPYGAAATGTRAVATSSGTYYRSTAAVTGQATTVRQSYSNFYQQYPALAVRWAGPTYRPVAWAALAATSGYPAEPVSYDYGDTVTYQGDTVYVNGEQAGTAEQYSEQATEIAATGKEAKADPKAEDWQSLGVFAMVKGEETTSSNIFQLAVNKDGVIRGDYYNALTDETSPVYGSVDKKTQRAAWTVADRKKPVYEAGIANLTKNETTMLVHFGKDNAQQFTLVRIEQPTETP